MVESSRCSMYEQGRLCEVSLNLQQSSLLSVQKLSITDETVLTSDRRRPPNVLMVITTVVGTTAAPFVRALLLYVRIRRSIINSARCGVLVPAKSTNISRILASSLIPTRSTVERSERGMKFCCLCARHDDRMLSFRFVFFLAAPPLMLFLHFP